MKQNTAVLVIDVQNALCVGEGATHKAMDTISNINDVTTKARKVEAPIIFIQHETQGGDFANASIGWQLAAELNRSSMDRILTKHASDAFSNTGLKMILDQIQINHLVICGMQSEFCVDSTIRHALALNYSITVVADGHTTISSQIIPAEKISAHHNYTWENITSYSASAKVINAKNIRF